MRAAIIGFVLIVATIDPVRADPDAARGQQFFAKACVACHSLQADRNMTGPSLSGIFGRKAGTLPSFSRYSPALKSSGVVWGDQTLDPWLANPKAFIPDNHMTFPGLPQDEARSDIIAFMKEATKPGETAPMLEGMMGMGASAPSLKSVPPSSQVTAINYCRDTYNITTADGLTAQFWERNLRFKTDSSEDGPPKGSPAIVGAGMVGDRSSVIFAAPEEIGQFIKRRC